jgi:hypothetical protein
MNSDYDEYYSSVESESEDECIRLTQEDWIDWNSEELLNVWMSIVEYHETWYLPLRQTFNQFCEFVYDGEEDDDGETVFTPEVQAIAHHPFVKNKNWIRFFSLKYK